MKGRVEIYLSNPVLLSEREKSLTHWCNSQNWSPHYCDDWSRISRASTPFPPRRNIQLAQLFGYERCFKTVWDPVMRWWKYLGDIQDVWFQEVNSLQVKWPVLVSRVNNAIYLCDLIKLLFPHTLALHYIGRICVDGLPYSPRAEHVSGAQVAGPELSLGTQPVRESPPAPHQRDPSQQRLHQWIAWWTLDDCRAKHVGFLIQLLDLDCCLLPNHTTFNPIPIQLSS